MIRYFFITIAIGVLALFIASHSVSQIENEHFQPIIIEFGNIPSNNGIEVLLDNKEHENDNDAPTETEKTVSKQEFQTQEQEPAPKETVKQEKPETFLFTEINKEARGALVNILCTTKSGGPLNPITGSGIMIDERGVILTNAHIAQYLLLKNYLIENFIDCVIRTESPAKPTYRADLLYISPQWIENNAAVITKSNPIGTGEDDYAFLLIRERTDPKKDLPETFPFVVMDTDSLYVKRDAPILIASYPAGFLSGSIVQKNLYSISTIASIEEIFTFETSTPDIFSTGGNLAAQQGSSGGAVIGNHKKLIGIITISSTGETTADRDLRAITISHINRSLVKYSNQSLNGLLSGDIEAKANEFNQTIAPLLTELLVAELEK